MNVHRTLVNMREPVRMVLMGTPAPVAVDGRELSVKPVSKTVKSVIDGS